MIKVGIGSPHKEKKKAAALDLKEEKYLLI
jgi:hypothetical protein